MPRLTLDSAAPALFVLLWSTGFIGAKYGLPYAEPMTFLTLRFMAVAVILAVWAFVKRDRWPTAREAGRLAVAGLLAHVGYLGGVFTAIHLGLESGVSALITGLQPVASAILAAAMLGESTSRRQMIGLVLGVAGVALVVENKLSAGVGDWRGVGLCLMAMLSMTIGALYQKKYCSGIPLASGNTVQFAASAVIGGSIALMFETRDVQWTGHFVFALAWLVVVLSIGAIGLLYYLLRHGASARATSLFFMTPPTAAFFGWLLFGETLSPTAILGFVLAATGVALAMRAPRDR